MPDPDREIYPNAPLKIVAFELRFPQVAVFDRSEGHEAVYDRLRDVFPIPGPPPQLQFEVAGTTARQQSHGARFLNRRRTASTTLLPDLITVETSDYEKFERFVELIEQVIRAAHEIGKIPGVARIGLRYIDEIVVPGIEGAAGWADYVEPQLLAPITHFDDLDARDLRGRIEFGVGDNRSLGMTFGILTEPVVTPEGPLRILDSPEGEYFLIDLDSYWTAPVDELPAFAENVVVELCEELHAPIRSIFERSITDKLRNEVLREESSNG